MINENISKNELKRIVKENLDNIDTILEIIVGEIEGKITDKEEKDHKLYQISFAKFHIGFIPIELTELASTRRSTHPYQKYVMASNIIARLHLVQEILTEIKEDLGIEDKIELVETNIKNIRKIIHKFLWKYSKDYIIKRIQNL